MATTRDEPPLPPPPPPATSASSVTDEALQAPLPPPPAMSTPNSASSSDGELSPSGTLVRRKDSNGSSVSSESLPFACENVGTIKQRPGEGVPPPLPQHGTSSAPAGPSPTSGTEDGLDKPPHRTSPPTTTTEVRSPPEEVPVRGAVPITIPRGRGLAAIIISWLYVCHICHTGQCRHNPEMLAVHQYLHTRSPACSPHHSLAHFTHHRYTHQISSVAVAWHC